jgi:hypothetical protein
VSDSEAARADAQAEQRVLEHRLQTAQDATSGPRAPWSLAVALVAAGGILGALGTLLLGG